MPHHLPPFLGLPRPGSEVVPSSPEKPEGVFDLRRDMQLLYLNAGRLQLSLPEVPQTLNPNDSITVFHNHRPCKMSLGDLADMMLHAGMDRLRRHPDYLRVLAELVAPLVMQRINLARLINALPVATGGDLTETYFAVVIDGVGYRLSMGDLLDIFFPSIEDGLLTESGDFILAEDGDTLDEE